jgi:SOS response regulatory protein OraA/RecX
LLTLAFVGGKLILYSRNPSGTKTVQSLESELMESKVDDERTSTRLSTVLGMK